MTIWTPTFKRPDSWTRPGEKGEMAYKCGSLRFKFGTMSIDQAIKQLNKEKKEAEDFIEEYDIKDARIVIYSRDHWDDAGFFKSDVYIIRKETPEEESERLAEEQTKANAQRDKDLAELERLTKMYGK